MNYADMILDSVGVANLDEVNLSYMIVSVVIFQKFTWLDGTLHNDMECKGMEHYQALWTLACSSMCIQLIPKVPKVPYGSNEGYGM